MLNLKEGLLLLTYKMENHKVAEAYREAGRLGDIYQGRDKCRPCLFYRRVLRTIL